MIFLKEQLREEKSYFFGGRKRVCSQFFFDFILKKISDVLTQWKCFITVLDVSPTVAGVVPNEHQN